MTDSDPASPLPVYVIHYHAPEWCEQTVASIRASTLPVSVTVIDNGGLGELSGVRTLRSVTNRGFSGGANAALSDWLQHSDAPWCLITSHDLELAPGTLAELVALGEAAPDVGIVGANLGRAGGRGRLDRHQADLVARSRRPRPEVPTVVRGAERCSWASGSCLLLRRPMVEDVGPFDERFGSYLEDVDYGFRALTAGWVVLVAAHARGTTTGTAHSLRAARLKATNGPLVGAKTGGRRRMLRSLANNLAGSVRGMLTAGFAPDRSAFDESAARCLGAVESLPVLARWYAHVAGRRVEGRRPVDALCHDAWLSAHTGDPSARP